MQGIKHALAYTKSSEVISTALSLLKVLDSPQLITQVLSNLATFSLQYNQYYLNLVRIEKIRFSFLSPTVLQIII